MNESEIFKSIYYQMIKLKKTTKSIAKELNRHPSTIKRWLNKGGQLRMSKLHLLLHSVGLKLIIKIKDKAK